MWLVASIQSNAFCSCFMNMNSAIQLLVGVLVCCFIAPCISISHYADLDTLEGVNKFRPVGDVVFDFDTSWRFLHYAYATYDMPSDRWECHWCKNVTNFKLTQTCKNTKLGGYAYVGYNPDFDEIVAAYRGSMNIQNWIEDFDVFMEPNATFSAQYPDARVEDGFFIYVNSTKECVYNEIERLASMYPSYTVSITGHSLGAAGATLAAMDLAVNYGYENVAMLNFGSPRVGNKAFANLAPQYLPTAQRMVNGGDCVPKLPWIDIGYYHITTEIYETPSGGQNYKVCSGGDGEICGDGLPWNCSAHTDYMNLT